MKFFFMLTAFICGSVSFSLAQVSIKGKLVDSTTGKPLGLATITVFKAADTGLITYRLSDPAGDFKVPGLPAGVECRVVVSYSGYAVYRKEFTSSAGQSSIDLGSINMRPSSVALDEVLVVAERPPVSMRKDTIEFNANAFKTLPNALTEDLLKKLPGVQVDADGNITVNGKAVNRILVDGKTFFGDDPKMATRNLPANVIDKVQVTDDKEEMLRNGDDNLANVGKVVNITLKKGVKKGMFGKVYAGGGTQNRFEFGGIANVYRDTFQISLLGYANNLNKPGFGLSDLMQAGGLGRNRNTGGGGSTSIWNSGMGSGISINGVNFGGMQSYGGVTTSKGIGFNLNHAPNSKQSVFLQYFRGWIDVDRRNFTDTKQYNADTIINNTNYLNGNVSTQAHNIGAGARLKPDSVTNILLMANYTIGLQDEDRFSDIRSVNNQRGPLSYGNIIQDNLANTYSYRHSITVTRLSATKKGRRFNFAHNFSVNNRFNDYSTESAVRYLYPNVYDSSFSQLRNERMPSSEGNVTLNYSEPISKILTLRIGAKYDFSRLFNTVNTFNKNNVTQKYDVLNNSLSSRLSRYNDRTAITPGLEIAWKKLKLTPSVKIQWQHIDNNIASLPDAIRQEQRNLLPQLQLEYKKLVFNYSKDITLPSSSYLIPVTNNSNPFYITKGNSSLVPVIKDNFSVNLYYNDPKRNFNAGGFLNYAISQKDIIQSVVVDEKGVQTVTPVNVNGGRSLSSNYNINKQFRKNPKFIFSIYTGAYYGYDRSRLLFNNESSWQSTFQLSQWSGFNINLNDKLEFNTGLNFTYNFTDYTSKSFKKLEVVDYVLSNELIIRPIKHVVLEGQTRYSFIGSLPAGTPKGAMMFNAAINFTMLKNERAILRISGFDLLKQSRSLNLNASKNVVTLNRTNILPQYFMGTFTYNFRPGLPGEGKKKVGGERFLLF